jgi:hypothetical protein
MLSNIQSRKVREKIIPDQKSEKNEIVSQSFLIGTPITP